MASSLARPPAFRITCASPSANPAYFAGSSLASMQVRMAKCLAGGKASFALSPNPAAYLAFAARTSDKILIRTSFVSSCGWKGYALSRARVANFSVSEQAHGALAKRVPKTFQRGYPQVIESAESQIGCFGVPKPDG